MKKDNTKSFLFGMLTSFVICILIGAVLTGGVLVALKVQSESNDGLVAMANGAFTEEEIDKLVHYKQKLQTSYYEEITDEAILDGMLAGMMEATRDPYTCYYTIQEMEDLTSDMQGTFQGIGAYVQADLENGYCKVSGVMKGSPAEEADIKQDDYIIYVDEEDMYGQSIDYVVSKIRGPEGTSVDITLNRGGQRVEVSVVRREIKTESVTYELREDNIGYIQIAEFDDGTSEQFANAMKSFEADGCDGLLIDLRGNPGGNLTAVVEVCEQLLPQGLIVYTEDKYGERKEFYSDGDGEFNKPMVVLIDGSSASAAEIMAGAIKDYGKGELVGTTTFGKGIVQAVFVYTDGSGGKVTTSKYFTPNGINIHKVGIEPDIEVEFDGEKYMEDGTDNQYNEAVRVLKEKME